MMLEMPEVIEASSEQNPNEFVLDHRHLFPYLPAFARPCTDAVAAGAARQTANELSVNPLHHFSPPQRERA